MTRILVVDDEPQMLRAIRVNLRARPGVACRKRQQRSGPGGVPGWERKWERVLLTSALFRFSALACAPPGLRRRTLMEATAL
jgi:hypothetical protein